MSAFRSKYGMANIQGYLRDKESDYVIINYFKHHTLIKFQKWGVLIVKIVTKHFGRNLADKKSEFIPKAKLNNVKVTRQKHINCLMINGRVAVSWKTFSPHAYEYQKLKHLIKKYQA